MFQEGLVQGLKLSEIKEKEKKRHEENKTEN